MKVYLVWDGYEDVVAVFLSKEKAESFIDHKVQVGPTSRDNWSITECDVMDAPTTSVLP